VEAKVMKRCQYVDEYGKRCNRGLKTGWKYCYEHRHSSPSPEGSVIDKATNQYIKFHTTGIIVVPLTILVVMLLPFLALGFYWTDQFFTIISIGLFVCIIPAFYIAIKYGKIRFLPWNAVRDRKPDYVAWVQKRIDRAKEEREFKKNLWK
jgi:hypothetical protein